jgi:hypothetical protein
MVVLAQAKGITGILNGVEDIVRPDNEDLGLDVLYDATSLEKKLECKATIQKATVRSTETAQACATLTLLVLSSCVPVFPHVSLSFSHECIYLSFGPSAPVI